MGPDWSSNFSYDYFRKILRTIKSNFELHLLSEAPQILNTSGQFKLILRHDVDVSLKKALRMAEIEKDFGICATYMVMLNSPLYSLEDRIPHNILLQIIDMGHEIGLHFDLDEEDRNSNCEISSVETKINSACRKLENIINLPLSSISFHRSQPQFFRGPLIVCDRVNAYAKELMDWYLSDSKGRWREGEPLPKLLKPNKPLLQLLIHPIWWGDKHMLPEDRLQAFFDEETHGQSSKYIKAFSASLANITRVKRRGLMTKTFYR